MTRTTAPEEARSGAVASVAVARPSRGTLCWTVRQPGSIEAFEQTAIVPRVAGYVAAWNVDIGDRVRKGDTLALLWVPDLDKERDQRRAEVDQARRLFEVAEAHLTSATAAVAEARAALDRARADRTYRQLQHRRVDQLVGRSVVNKQVEEEARNELQAAEANVNEARARLERAEADRKESEAVRNKAGADIDVAQAALGRIQAMVDYATLKAPYDGIVTRRTLNTGDYVRPPDGASNEPLYVLQRRDLMRVFVEVPEADAVWIRPGCPARIDVPALPGREFRGTVRRSSYALKLPSRTLVAEIDLPNPDDLLRPGMYAYASLRVERRGVLTLPDSAVVREGDVNEGYRYYCYLLDGQRVRRTPVAIGRRGGGRVQILKKYGRYGWQDFDGREQVVSGAPSTPVDGQQVAVRSGAGGAPREGRPSRAAPRDAEGNAATPEQGRPSRAAPRPAPPGAGASGAADGGGDGPAPDGSEPRPAPSGSPVSYAPSVRSCRR